MTENTTTNANNTGFSPKNTAEDLKAPLLAAVGAADLALATVNEILISLRERAGEVREEANTRVEGRRAVITKLGETLPKRTEELREKLTTEELRKAAEAYLDSATTTYNNLIARGEIAVERLRSQSDFHDTAARAEEYFDQAVELTQEALGSVSSQTRAVGQRAAKLVGVELPKKTTNSPAMSTSERAKKAPAKKAPAKKTPAKKATAKKTSDTKTAPH